MVIIHWILTQMSIAIIKYIKQFFEWNWRKRRTCTIYYQPRFHFRSSLIKKQRKIMMESLINNHKKLSSSSSISDSVLSSLLLIQSSLSISSCLSSDETIIRIKTVASIGTFVSYQVVYEHCWYFLIWYTVNVPRSI